MRKYGLIKDDKENPSRPDKKKVVNLKVGAPPPSKFSLAQFNLATLDQGDIGACTGYASSAAVYNLFSQLEGSNLSWVPSSLWTYWQSRALEGTTSTDGGAQLRDTFLALQNKGIATVDDYNPTTAFIPPPIDLNPHLRITGSESINWLTEDVVQTMINVLAIEQLPIVIGVDVYDSFESNETAATGNIPMPDTTKENLLGGHALMLFGYDSTANVFLGKNSWGSSWGNNGDFTIPFQYIANQLLTNSLWTFQNNYW